MNNYVDECVYACVSVNNKGKRMAFSWNAECFNCPETFEFDKGAKWCLLNMRVTLWGANEVVEAGSKWLTSYN